MNELIPDSHHLAPGRFFGERQSACQFGSLMLTEYRYAPDQIIPRHAHSLAYFCIVLHGGYREKYDAKVRECSAADLIFHPEGETHSDRFAGGGGHIFSIEAAADWLAHVRQHTPVLDRPAELKGGEPYLLGMKLFREYAEPDSAAALAIEGLTLEILSAAVRSAEKAEQWQPAWLRTAEEYLRAHFREEIRLETLAAQVGVHPSHFARTFRTHFRCTAGEFLRRLRVEHACRLLRAQERDLAALAAELGFADQSHFTRTFRLHTGYTPREYRRQLS